MQQDPLKFEALLRLARQARGLSRDQLGKLLSPPVDLYRIGLWERAERKPNVDHVRSLCVALEFSADMLLGLVPFALALAAPVPISPASPAAPTLAAPSSSSAPTLAALALAAPVPISPASPAAPTLAAPSSSSADASAAAAALYGAEVYSAVPTRYLTAGASAADILKLVRRDFQRSTRHRFACNVCDAAEGEPCTGGPLHIARIMQAVAATLLKAPRHRATDADLAPLYRWEDATYFICTLAGVWEARGDGRMLGEVPPTALAAAAACGQVTLRASKSGLPAWEWTEAGWGRRANFYQKWGAPAALASEHVDAALHVEAAPEAAPEPAPEPADVDAAPEPEPLNGRAVEAQAFLARRAT